MMRRWFSFCCVVLLAVYASACVATPTPVPQGAVVPTRATLTATPTPSQTFTPTATLTPSATNTPVASSTPIAISAAAIQAQQAFVLGDSTAELPLLSFGSAVEGRLTAEQFIAPYQFEGVEGLPLFANVTVLQGDRVLFLILLGPDGREVARSVSVNLNDVVLPEDGRYTLLVTRRNAQFIVENDSRYMLSLGVAEDDGTQPIMAQTLTFGESVQGEITDGTPDVYVFQATRGQRVTITNRKISERLDTYLILTTNTGFELTRNDDVFGIGEGVAAVQNFTIPADGWYTVLATRWEQSTDTGDYTLTLSENGVDENPIDSYAVLNPLLSGLRNSDAMILGVYLIGENDDDMRSITQSIVTFTLPSNNGDNFGTATLDISQCFVSPRGLVPLRGINIYLTEYSDPNEIEQDFAPDEPLVDTLADCDFVDVSSEVAEAYANGQTVIQFRLSPQRIPADNGRVDQVWVEPRLILTFED
jgi:hypothetical protein